MAKIDFSLFHVFIISLVLMAMLGVIGTLIAKARNWDAGKREAFKNGTMFSNAGNIGIALIALVSPTLLMSRKAGRLIWRKLQP